MAKVSQCNQKIEGALVASVVLLLSSVSKSPGHLVAAIDFIRGTYRDIHLSYMPVKYVAHMWLYEQFDGNMFLAHTGQ